MNKATRSHPFRKTPSTGFYDLCIRDPELLERITARGAELDELEEQLAKQLTEIQAERCRGMWVDRR